MIGRILIGLTGMFLLGVFGVVCFLAVYQAI